MDWLPAALTGFSIGLAFTAVPGPVTTESIRRSVTSGFWPGFWVNLGSCIGDVVWAGMGLTGAAVFLAHDAIAVALGLVGVGLLFSLARKAVMERNAIPDSGTQLRHGGSFRVGVMFGLANPSGIAFWSGIGTGMLATLGSTSFATIAVLIAAYLLAGMLLSTAFCITAMLGGRLLGNRVVRWVNLVSGIALCIFGVRQLVITLQRAQSWLLPMLRPLW